MVSNDTFDSERVVIPPSCDDETAAVEIAVNTGLPERNSARNERDMWWCILGKGIHHQPKAPIVSS